MKTNRNAKKRTTFDRHTLKKILQLLRKDRWQLILSLLCALLTTASALAIPMLVGKGVDCLVGQGKVDWNGVRSNGILIGICAVVGGLSQWLMSILNNRLTYGLVYRLREETFEKLQRLPLSYLDSHSVGETVSRMMTDVDQFTDGLLLGFNQFFTGFLTIIGTLVIMLTVKPSIALVVIFLTPLSLFAASYIAKSTYSLFRLQSDHRADQTALIDELVGEHKTVVAFGQEEQSIQRFDQSNEKLRKSSLKALFYSSLTNPTTRFVNNLVYAGVALVGAFLCIPVGSATFTVGKLTAFLSYANQYTKPFNEISGVLAELQNALACAAKLFEMTDAEEEIPDGENALVLEKADGRVSLENVCFSYTPERKLIENLNLSVDPGQRIALVGRTGCGKTTVINLLMRYYEVNSGSVKVSGTDIREMTRHSLRANWGMVLQETWLKSGTVRENLCMAKEDATEEEMIAAAKAAHADSFIRRLPKGYDTVLGEGGGSLSQGQKQLLCIARVMLAPPPMLILDEATSSIDTRMELKIQDAFSKLMQGRTCFVVAHRLSTVVSSDLILVMKDGTIAESGTHAELMRLGGYYAELYQSRHDGSLENEVLFAKKNTQNTH